MPRKKVNGNIISVRVQNIRLREEIIAVNRRIGGLENAENFLPAFHIVNRRTGGLEILTLNGHGVQPVNRRIGGLERRRAYSRAGVGVNRRIGGLEIYNGHFC